MATLELENSHNGTFSACLWGNSKDESILFDKLKVGDNHYIGLPEATLFRIQDADVCIRESFCGKANGRDERFLGDADYALHGNSIIQFDNDCEKWLTVHVKQKQWVIHTGTTTHHLPICSFLLFSDGLLLTCDIDYFKNYRLTALIVPGILLIMPSGYVKHAGHLKPRGFGNSDRAGYKGHVLWILGGNTIKSSKAFNRQLVGNNDCQEKVCINL